MTGTAIRGLTTVALLKVNYDANVDHLELFMPFILETLRTWTNDGFLVEDLTPEISARLGLKMPVEGVRTLLNRVCKKGHLHREHGRFFRNFANPITVDLTPQREAIEREHMAVARRFIEFARPHGVELPDEEQALNLLLAFLEANDVAIVIEPKPATLLAAADQQSTRELRTVALFISEILKAEPILTEYVQRMLEGLILQNGLLLTNINFKKRQFRNLEVFFDTGFLFRAVGLSFDAYLDAAREALTMLREANARVSVFSNTIDEMRRVLVAVGGLIGTPEGIRQLRPTELVRFLLSRHYRPSDVAEASALLEVNISQLGLTIRNTPERIPAYTLDELALAQILMRPDQTEIDSRIEHEQDVVAAVLTLRAGRVRYTLDDARAIFATTTSRVVKNVTTWYKGQGVGGIPPIVHQVGLSNVAWLKNPGHAMSRLKRHELVALCAAALQPTPRMMNRVKEEVRRFKESGKLTSDEEVAVLTSHLLDIRLAEIVGEEDVDAETVVDIIERVRESYAGEAERRVAKAVEAKQKELAPAIEAAQAAVREHEERGRAAIERALKSEEEKRQLELRVIQKANLIASWVARVCSAGLGVIVAAGILLGLPGLSLASSFGATILAGVVLGIYALLNFVDLHKGLSGAHLRSRLQSYVARKLMGWWLGPRETI